MLGWSISASACREPGDHVMRVHPGFNDLEDHPTSDGLLGDDHEAKTAFADLLDQLVWTDHRADLLGPRRSPITVAPGEGGPSSPGSLGADCASQTTVRRAGFAIGEPAELGPGL